MERMVYSGFGFPDIESVWTDKKTYPYAVLFNVDGAVRLQLSNFRPVAFRKYSDSTTLYVGTNNKGDGDLYLAYKFNSNNATWEFYEEYSGTSAGIHYDMITSFPPIWTSHDIINIVDDSIYLAACNPVVEVPFYRMENGTWVKKRAYQRINGEWVAVSAVEYAMYDYNGYTLPALPNWDKTLYPYAMITAFSFGSLRYYHLIVTNKKIRRSPDNGISDFWKEADSLWLHSNVEGIKGNVDVSEMELWGILSPTSRPFGDGTPIWANYNVYNTDGSLFLKASKPVFVHE